jgi:Mg-chelatase subunit ChlD
MKSTSRFATAAVVLSVAGLLLWKSHAGARTTGQTQGQTLLPTISSPNGERAKVDIVFALDTTGSMSGLLEGAKTKIWEIARKAQEGQPAPELRIGLVAYRDKGDDYVTKVVPLTTDLDAVYAQLTAFQAGGGGDGPEHVLRGLDDAVSAAWSTDPKAVKLVYLVGDAPPHFDYQDGITLDSVMTKAKQNSVHVSAIRCGQDSSTLAAWTDIAKRSGGEVATIEQTGGVVAVATPYDTELARLNAELAKTEVHWGSLAEQKEADSVVARNMAAPAAAQADRAGFYASRGAGGVGGATKKDLAADPTALDKVATSDLPPEMQAMSAEERAKFVEGKKKDREAVLEKISALSAKRSAHLRSAAPATAASAFDGRVYDSLKKAGAESGIRY